MKTESRQVDLLSIWSITMRRWPLLTLVPIGLAVITFMLYPSPQPIHQGTSTVAATGVPSPVAIEAAKLAARDILASPVQIEADGTVIRVSGTAADAPTLERVLKAAVDDLRRVVLHDEKDIANIADALRRSEDQLSVLRAVVGPILNQLKSGPPPSESRSADYGSIAEALVALTDRISELEARKFELQSQRDLPLVLGAAAVTDIVRVEGRDHRMIAAVLTGVFSVLIILVVLLLREAIDRLRPTRPAQ